MYDVRGSKMLMCVRVYRLLDKIAKDIMVCENKTVRRWDGSIGEYKNHLRKKMMSTGAV
jgi:ATP-binding cassette subfamily F protein 2